MQVNYSSSWERKKEKFIKDIIESEIIYYVFNKEWYIAYVESNVEDISCERDPIVHLMWSNKWLANQAIKTSFEWCEIWKMEIKIFLEKFLKEIYEDGDFIGVNWIAPEFVWPELDPLELKDEIIKTINS